MLLANICKAMSSIKIPLHADQLDSLSTTSSSSSGIELTLLKRCDGSTLPCTPDASGAMVSDGIEELVHELRPTCCHQPRNPWAWWLFMFGSEARLLWLACCRKIQKPKQCFHWVMWNSCTELWTDQHSTIYKNLEQEMPDLVPILSMDPWIWFAPEPKLQLTRGLK